MMKNGKYTTEESMAALAMTAEEIEAVENEPKEPQTPMGKYGNLFWDYLKENRPGRHGFLLAETTLRDVCLQVDKEAREMMETLQKQLRAKKPRPQNDFMATVRYETAIRDRAEEIVLNEIVYRPR
ncbi:MAG: TnpV protein [Clostridiales Family XIII bacterium]|nr:TnpV protein [Clostridiales Family XIII bacterium]